VSNGIWCVHLGILGTGHAGILPALSECKTKAVTVQSGSYPAVFGGPIKKWKVNVE